MAKKTVGRYLLKTLGVLLFCIVSGYAIFLAYGYTLDFQHRDIQKTSIIDIPTNYSQVRVFLDSQLVGNSLPLQMKDLLPGNYKLFVTKLGYLPWSRELPVQTDFVTKVDDVVLVPEQLGNFTQQLVHFPSASRYFYGDSSFVVFSPNANYLTVVSFQHQGTIKEDDFQLSRLDIQDVHVYSPSQFLITFLDNSYQWVDLGSSNPVTFGLPKGSGTPEFLPSQNSAFFTFQNNLYRASIDQLGAITPKLLQNDLLLKNVDEFHVYDAGLFYLSGGSLYQTDLGGKNKKVLAESHNLLNFRYIPYLGGSGGLFVLRTNSQDRYLYASDANGNVALLTSHLSGDVFQDNNGRVLFADNEGRILFYKPVTQKMTLVTVLPPDFTLMGTMMDDGHFLFTRQQKIYLSDRLFSNVYPLFDFDQNAHYFIQNGAFFSLSDQKLKSLYFLPN